MDLEVMDTRQERFIREEPVTDATGRVRWVQTIKRPIVDPGGRADQVLGVATDVTELKRAREELVERQREEQRKVLAELDKVKDELVRQTRLAAIGQVAASIAHELRNPLGAISNAVFLLRRRVPATERKWAEYLDIIGQELQTSERIVSNLLEMSRAREPAREPVDLGRELEAVFAQIRTPQPVRLCTRLDPQPFVLQADPGLLRQLLTNLLTNACQSMARGGEITVEARVEAQAYVVSVSDEGHGIPSELRARVFEPLFTTRAKGTGLGLAICRQIVERHGGAIEVAPSERGALLRFRLPRS
jgi:signal transduction histidine kinase